MLGVSRKNLPLETHMNYTGPISPTKSFDVYVIVTIIIIIHLRSVPTTVFNNNKTGNVLIS